MPITNLSIDSISIVVISTYIVNIANHIMGKMWPSYCIFCWCSLDTSTTWSCQSIIKFVWLYGLLQRWTSLIFCQYLNSFVQRRITLFLNFLHGRIKVALILLWCLRKRVRKFWGIHGSYLIAGDFETSHQNTSTKKVCEAEASKE